MKISQIIDSWKTDTKIDDLNIDLESARTISLHGKYMEWLSDARGTLRGLRIHRKHLWRKLYDYYRGASTEDDLLELGKEQNPRHILKTEATGFIEADQLMIDLDSKIAVQEEKVDILAEIIKSVNSRNYALKNIIEWRRMSLGG